MWWRRVGWAFLALAVAGCAGAIPANGASPVRPRAPRSSVASLERQVFDLVNAHRARRRLPALVFDARIAREARAHSAAMAAGRRRLGHAGFDDRSATLRRIIACRGSAENVAFNEGYRDPAAQAFRGWLGSRGHRKNMDGRYDATGVGVAWSDDGGFYVTQLFVAYR